jgi:hypothetical protein
MRRPLAKSGEVGFPVALNRGVEVSAERLDGRVRISVWGWNVHTCNEPRNRGPTARRDSVGLRASEVQTYLICCVPVPVSTCQRSRRR